MSDGSHSYALEIPSIGWRLDAHVSGVPIGLLSAFAKRWRPAPAGEAVADVRIAFEVCHEPVGFAASPLVSAHVTYPREGHASIVANASHAELSWEGATLHGTGRLHAPHALGGLESMFRAVAVLSLARRGLTLLHASAVREHGDGVLFVGDASAGKTTTARRVGREGLCRIADDMILVDLTRDPPTLHPVPFERAGRAMPVGTEYPVACRGALLIRKGAKLPTIEPCADAPDVWSSARVALAPRPGDEAATLAQFARLCRIPVGVFHVPPSGPLAPCVRAWIRAAAPERLDAGGDHAHAAQTVTLSRPPLPSAPPTSHAAMKVPADRKAPPSIALAARVERSPNVAWRVLDGTAVLVAPASPTIRTLNAVGTKVWELADGRSLGDIVDAVVNEFDVTSTQAEVDVQDFVRDLAAKGLLVVGGS